MPSQFEAHQARLVKSRAAECVIPAGTVVVLRTENGGENVDRLQAHYVATYPRSTYFVSGRNYYTLASVRRATFAEWAQYVAA